MSEIDLNPTKGGRMGLDIVEFGEVHARLELRRGDARRLTVDHVRDPDSMSFRAEAPSGAAVEESRSSCSRALSSRGATGRAGPEER